MSGRRRDIRSMVWLVVLGSAWVSHPCSADESSSAQGIDPPPYGDFLVVPLRVHILTATDLPEIDCALTDTDIHRILGKVNTIWHQAGIHWGLEALIREPAARQEEFKKRKIAHRDRAGPPLGVYPRLVPVGSKTKEGFHIYYIHQFSVNGVYLGDATAFVQETARLRQVEGGIDEPLPRVTAHELGHALDLPHRQERTNLLASGTTGTTLNAAEVERAREAARETPGVWTADDLKRAAQRASQAGRPEEARRFWSHLAALPGQGGIEAARRRDDISLKSRN